MGAVRACKQALRLRGRPFVSNKKEKVKRVGGDESACIPSRLWLNVIKAQSRADVRLPNQIRLMGVFEARLAVFFDFHGN
jgi:hypothetical protein